MAASANAKVHPLQLNHEASGTAVSVFAIEKALEAIAGLHSRLPVTGAADTTALDETVRLLDLCGELADAISSLKNYGTLLQSLARSLETFTAMNEEQRKSKSGLKTRERAFEAVSAASRCRIGRLPASQICRLKGSVTLAKGGGASALKAAANLLSVEIPGGLRCRKSGIRGGFLRVLGLRSGSRGAAGGVEELLAVNEMILRLNEEMMSSSASCSFEVVKELTLKVKKCVARLDGGVDRLEEALRQLHCTLISFRMRLLDSISYSLDD